MFEISRRDLVFGAAGAYAAFGLTKRIAFIGVAEAQQTGQRFRKYKVGDIEVVSLYDGVWEKAHDESPSEGSPRADQDRPQGGWATDALVPITFTMIGDQLGRPASADQFGYRRRTDRRSESRRADAEHGRRRSRPKTVKTIVVSHFHADHIFGLMAKDTNAQMFPEAEIIVPATELKWWTQPVDSIPQPRRGLAQRVQATFPNWKNVKPVEGEAEVAPGVRAIPAHGHTQGHTAHLISSGGRQLLATADVTNIQALFVKNPEWQAAFDHVPDQAVETRKRLFDRAIADKAMVAGYHWGLPNVGTIAKDGSGYAFTPAAAS